MFHKKRILVSSLILNKITELFAAVCMFYLEYAFIHLSCITVKALEAAAVDELGITHFVVYFSR